MRKDILFENLYNDFYKFFLQNKFFILLRMKIKFYSS